MTASVQYQHTEPNRQGKYQHDLSYSDCMRSDDKPWTVEIPVTQTGQGTVELWVAENDSCALDFARHGGQCRRGPLNQSGDGSTYTLTAQDIVGALGIVGCDDASGRASGQTMGRHVSLNFILTGTGTPEQVPGAVDPANIASLPITVDLLGPSPPAFTLDAQGGMLKLDLPRRPQDSDTVGFYVFLSPNPRPAPDANEPGGAASSGVTSSATRGSSSGGSTGSAARPGPGSKDCPAHADLPGVDPTRPQAGSSARYDLVIASTASSAVIDGLDDGTSYAVAVAAYDGVNNVGKLSSVQCGTPQPTDTFLKVYCLDGGSACVGGCGSCGVGADAEPGSAAWLAVAAAATLGLGRRRRPRTQRRNAVEAE